jgi:hypothetical protein
MKNTGQIIGPSADADLLIHRGQTSPDRIAMTTGQHFETSEAALPINADGQSASRRNAGDLAQPSVSTSPAT